MNKYFFFLIASFCILLSNSYAYDENFDEGNRGIYQGECWTFSSTTVTSSSSNGGAISGSSTRTGQLTNLTNPHRVGSPCTRFDGSGRVSFEHYVHTLNGSSQKTLNLVLLDESLNVVDTLLTYEYISTSLVKSDVAVPYDGQYRLEWRWIGSGGQGRAWMDNVSITGINRADPDNGCGCLSESLPVNWGTVKAVKNGLTESISWSVNMEQNNHHFDIMRSTDGLMFQKVGQVYSAGNHQELKSYSYDFQEGSSLDQLIWYRIKQVDIDGLYEYSQTVNLIRQNHSSLEVSLENISQELHLHLIYSSESHNQLRLFDLRGNLIYSDAISITQPTTLPLQGLNRGIYILSIHNRKESFVRKIRL
ncbi:MAG: T9SS type A sorting domain-containing protein [Bacteroidota bacterium]